MKDGSEGREVETICLVKLPAVHCDGFGVKVGRVKVITRGDSRLIWYTRSVIGFVMLIALMHLRVRLIKACHLLELSAIAFKSHKTYSGVDPLG